MDLGGENAQDMCRSIKQDPTIIPDETSGVGTVETSQLLYVRSNSNTQSIAVRVLVRRIGWMLNTITIAITAIAVSLLHISVHCCLHRHCRCHCLLLSLLPPPMLMLTSRCRLHCRCRHPSTPFESIITLEGLLIVLWITSAPPLRLRQ